MRREHQPSSEEAETTSYTFHFQISNKGGRQACSVAVQAPNIRDATTCFRQNWPVIESMAREGLAARSSDDTTINLALHDEVRASFALKPTGRETDCVERIRSCSTQPE